MRICLICSEVFAWGKYGGFGRSTRLLGRELAARGHQVSVVVPLRAGQRPVEKLDGMTVLGFPATRPLVALGSYASAAADIYHSQEASLGSYLAQRAAPSARHVISFRDHKFLSDWLIELRRPSRSRALTVLAALYERNPLVRRGIRRADRLLCVSPHLQQPLQRAYGLREAPRFVGSPIDIPVAVPVKSESPVVVFVGRLDPRKRPERFIELATRFPDVEFVLAGAAQNPAFERKLLALGAARPNVHFAGFLQQFDSGKLSDLLSRAWVLVNCSTREGLPTSALEAMAHGCALLSEVDVTGWVARFGIHATEGDLEEPLRELLRGDRWRTLGAQGREFVRTHFALADVLDAHEHLYRELVPV